MVEGISLSLVLYETPKISSKDYWVKMMGFTHAVENITP